jgi:ATP-dependent Clp protease, protease subunit
LSVWFGSGPLLGTERSLERDHFMTADEAKQFGIVDKIVEHRGKKEDV